jgi:hypothetical protein
MSGGNRLNSQEKETFSPFKEIWQKAIEEYFTQGNPEWVLFQNGSVVWIPSDQYDCRDIVAYAKKLVSDKTLQDESKCVVNEHSDGIYFIKHGGEDMWNLWTVVSVKELQEQGLTNTQLTSKGMEALKKLAVQKLKSDCDELVVLETVSK